MNALIIIKSIVCLFADLMYILSATSVKERIDLDVARNLKWDRKRDSLKGNILRLNYLLLTKKEFRSIFYFRTGRHKCLAALSRLLLPHAKGIELGGDIGGGLMVSHHHSVIFPKKTGTNFRVGPGAVIDRDGDAPTFGNNVYVASNSTVIGGIHIGDNVIIGAGSVVTGDLPENGVYVGNPAKLIKHIDGNEALLNEIM